MTDEINSIRKYFQPIQPSIKWGDQHISYKEFKPSIPLQNYIYCYWQLKTNKALDENFSYRVVSDGCVDIFLNADQTEECFIMGFCKKFTAFDLEKKFNYIGIRFLPSFFSLFFNIHANDLSNKFQRLEWVDPDLALWAGTLKQNKNFQDFFNDKFESVLQKIVSKKIDHRFYQAISQILIKHGNVDVEKEMIAGLSPRQLRRIFNKNIGTSPKAFANVVRFQYILNAKPSKQSLKEHKIYFDVGFYDQAHFIKTFKTFYGVTPSEAFK